MPLKGPINITVGPGSVFGGNAFPGGPSFDIPGILVGGLGTPGIAINLPDWARVKAGVGFPRIPVGPPIDRRDLELPSRNRLPSLVPRTTSTKGEGTFRDAPRRNLPQIKEVLQVQAPPIALPIPQVRTGPSSTDGGPTSTSIHTGARKMPDLGGLFEGHFGLPGWEGIGDFGANLLGYGGPTVVNTPTVTTSPGVITGSVPIQPATPSFQGGTFGNGCEADPRNSYIMKFICGQWKWVKKRKRRSKRLATASDIKDLSALQGVLGSGKNLTTWIATHR